MDLDSNVQMKSIRSKTLPLVLVVHKLAGWALPLPLLLSRTKGLILLRKNKTPLSREKHKKTR